LTTKDVFEEVKLGFFIVGHTHEDINGCFGYLSKKLREENNYILTDLMKAFMISQEKPLNPQLIQEIPDFKSWVLGCLKDDLGTLVGHTDMHLFRFIIDLSGWPMMYKVSPIDLVWSPINAPLIRLWKANLDGSPQFSIRVLSLVPYCPIWGNNVSRSVKKEKFISAKLSKYVDF
jgi:hypothetical protein